MLSVTVLSVQVGLQERWIPNVFVRGKCFAIRALIYFVSHNDCGKFKIPLKPYQISFMYIVQQIQRPRTSQTIRTLADTFIDRHLQCLISRTKLHNSNLINQSVHKKATFIKLEVEFEGRAKELSLINQMCYGRIRSEAFGKTSDSFPTCISLQTFP
jgi:hypothetical protein